MGQVSRGVGAETHRPFRRAWIAAMLLAAGSGLAQASPGDTDLVSVANGEAAAAGDSFEAAVSDDGRYVVFQSNSTSILAGDTLRNSEIFLRDRQAGSTQRVSVASDGSAAGLTSWTPAISADGKVVAFVSNAPNLIPGRTSSQWALYVRDLGAHATEVVSAASDGRIVAGSDPSLSADGHTVVFDTETNLVRIDANADYDIYAHEVGEVRTPEIAFSIHPDMLAFGAQPVGTVRTLSFWLRNHGESALPVVDMHITGDAAAEFARSRDCHFVQPGDSCRIRVTFRPASAGPKSAVLRVVAGVDTRRSRIVTGEGT